MGYLGSKKLDSYLTFAINTHKIGVGQFDADSMPTYLIFEDITHTPIMSGSMSILDNTGTVGQYASRIYLSSTNGFERGKDYTIRITATVNGITESVDYNFQIEEMTAEVIQALSELIPGDTVSVYDKLLNLMTSTDVASAVDASADVPAILAIVNHADYGNAKLVRSTTPANTLSVDSNHGVIANLVYILGTLLTETTGYLAAGFKKFFNVATPVLTVAGSGSFIKGVALSNFPVMMTSDGVTPLTGLTVTAYISKDGGSFTAATNAVTALGFGWYLLNLTATEMNANMIVIRLTASGAKDRGIGIPTITL